MLHTKAIIMFTLSLIVEEAMSFKDCFIFLTGKDERCHIWLNFSPAINLYRVSFLISFRKFYVSIILSQVEFNIRVSNCSWIVVAWNKWVIVRLLPRQWRLVTFKAGLRLYKMRHTNSLCTHRISCWKSEMINPAQNFLPF